MKVFSNPEEAWRIMSLQPMPCILCGKLTMNRGQFTPNDPREFGVGMPPPGKERVAIYALCEKHPHNKEALQEIERRLKQNNH